MNQTCTYLKLKCGMYYLHFLLHLLSLTLNIKITKLSKMNKYKTDDNKNQCLQKLPRIWLRFFKKDIIDLTTNGPKLTNAVSKKSTST